MLSKWHVKGCTCVCADGEGEEVAVSDFSPAEIYEHFKTRSGLFELSDILANLAFERKLDDLNGYLAFHKLEVHHVK